MGMALQTPAAPRPADADPASGGARGGIEPTDDERDALVGRLREAVGAGRLDLAEFDRRAAAAYAASSRSQFAALTADLVPAPPRPPRWTGDAGAVLVRFGPLAITADTVRTPGGSFPLSGSVWRSYDYWQTRRVIPTAAIVAAVLGFFVVPFVSLLFLLVRQDQTTGVVQVCGTDGGRQHVVDLPVTGAAQAHAIHRQVQYVQLLAGR
ncbi:hypothetical protein GCM10009635_42650 [Actinocatenispora thailandica]